MLTHFPYESPRDSQLKALDELSEFLSSDDSYMVLELPTGVGKSGLAIAAAGKFLSDAKPECSGVTILTKTKILSEQYCNEFDLPSITGRCNYDSDEEFENDETNWLNSKLRVTNYHNIDKVPSGGLLIVDEAHEFLEYVNRKLTYEMVKPESDSEGMNFVYDLVSKYSNLKVRSLNAPFNNLCRRMKGSENFDFELYNFSRILRSISEINPECEVRCIHSDGKVVIHILGSRHYTEVISYYHSKIILMSATFGGIEYFNDMLGLTPYKYVSTPAVLDEGGEINEPEKYTEVVPKSRIYSSQVSPFCKNVRPIIVFDAYKLGMEDRESRVKHQVDEIIDNLISDHGSMDNGVIHTVSYEYAELLVEYSSHSSRMVIIRDVGDLKDLVPNSGTILVSPSLEEGVSFNGDLAKWQIIMKAPIEPQMGLNYVLKLVHGLTYLNRRGVLRITQMCGRIIRTEECSGPTYIVDGNYGRIAGPSCDGYWPLYMRENWTCFHDYESYKNRDYIWSTNEEFWI